MTRPHPHDPNAQSGQPADDALYPTLHLLRLLATLSIFTGHWSEPYVTQLWRQGQIAIDVFFMSEGFLAMRALNAASRSGGLGLLVWKRFLEIYPVYVLGLVAGLCSFAPFAFGMEQGWTVANWLSAFVSGLLLLPTFTTLVHGSVFPLNPPTWAIVLELIGFALLAGARIRRSIATVVLIWAAAIATFAILALFWRDPNAGWESAHYWGGLPRMLFGFFGGALLFTIRDRIGPRIPRLSPLLICAAFVAMQLPTLRYVGWPLLGLGVPLLVSLAAAARRPDWSVAAGAWAEHNALMVYVLGFPVMIIWRMLLVSDASPPTATGIGLHFLLATGSLVIAAVIANRVFRGAAREILMSARG